MAVKHLELLERAHEKVGSMVLVRADLLDDAELHLLTALVHRGFLKELSAGDLSFELLQLFAVVHQEVTQILGELWPADDDRIGRKLFVDRLHNRWCSMLAVAVL